MTIKEIQKKFNSIEIDSLLVHILKKPKEFLYMEPEVNLTKKQFKNLARFIKRRQNGEPLAYILGYKDFMNFRFKVNKDVLIPRPETEWLVERVLQAIGLLKKAQTDGLQYKPVRILDVGTGCGCIPISLAKLLPISKYPNIQIFASDISPAALKVAKENAKTHKVKIKFIQSDLFANIDGKFDIVVGNLPYVPLKLLHKFLHHKTKLKSDDPFRALKFEPSFALTDGTSSFQIYRRFFEQVKNHINPSGIIFLETDPSSKKFLIEYQKKHLPGWQMKFYKDYNNILRFVVLNHA